MSVTIYHNPRCSKSRKALEILNEKQIKISVCEYLKDGISAADVLEIAKMANINVGQMIRVKEDEFKENKVDLSDEKACASLIESFPKILERPIVIKDAKAVIARPPEKLEELF